jgi:hypothetical protein
MGVPTSEVGYSSATTVRGDHEVHNEHVVALGNNNFPLNLLSVKWYMIEFNYRVQMWRLSQNFPKMSASDILASFVSSNFPFEIQVTFRTLSVRVST